ncbi:MAG: aminopeptidase P family protein, partial [Aestuariivirgaceae bacterium]
MNIHVTAERPRLVDYRENGDKAPLPFSDAEMQRRQDAVRAIMADKGIDAAVFTSFHNICYLSGFLYCQFGRNYALVITRDKATSVSAAIDGGQPWRRTFGDNVTYTDWQRDNFFIAVHELAGNARCIGVEDDHMTLSVRRQLADAIPGCELVDISQATMARRMIKSPEEIVHIKKMTAIADLGGAACVEALQVGATEVEIARHSTNTMVAEIARKWPNSELMDTWTWFQSGINTDGAHNPLTTRRIEAGDILSLNCFPMACGYYVALERTLFAGHASDAHLKYWEVNCKVHEAGLKLLVPGAKCADIARELNEIYLSHDLLQYRSFGYGHSFGVLSHYYG